MTRRNVAVLAAFVAILSTASFAAAQSGTSTPGASFFTITPCRLADTRVGLGGGTLAPGEKRIIGVVGSCAIPPSALAVALNVIVVGPKAAGNARLFAGDAPAPATSTLNFRAGQVRANDALVRLASNGTIALQNFSAGSADYVIDLAGYFGCSAITVGPPGPALPPGTSGTPYSQTFTASGGFGSSAFTVTSGTPPAGVTLSSVGLLSGTPTQAGDFSFTVTATDTLTGCVGATAYTLHIACGTLAVTIAPTPAQVCAGTSGNGASATAGFATYAWTVTNGTIVGPANTQTITYTAGPSGSVGLTVNVTDSSSCPGQAVASVPINALPAPPTVLIANPQTFTVSGASGTFTLSFSGQTTTPLGFNATAAQVQSALNALSSIGGVGGSVAVTQAGGLYTVTFGGTLTGPQPQLTASGAGGCTVVVNPFAVCAGSTGDQASGPAGATTYTWTIANGTITSATNVQTITYTAGASGPLTLTLTVTNAAGCAASNNAQVTVNPTPATPTITPTPAQVCADSTGNTADGPAGATTYAWTITNGTITSAADIQTITYTAGSSGNVQLDLTVTNASGCAASNSIQVPINATPPTPPITPTPAQVCAGSTGNQATGPLGATTYAWTITNGTITSLNTIQTITYTAGTSGNVQLDLVVTNGAACVASNSALVPINALAATPPIATSNPQSFAVSGGSGTFTLTFSGQTTASLAFNATAAQVQTALNNLPSIGGVGGSTAVTEAAGVYTITFGGTLTGPQPQLTASGAGGCTVIVTAPAVCADSTTNQASGPAGAATYAWTITNGTITSAANIQTITYTAGSSGTVTLGLTVTNGPGCAATNSVDLTVNANPATPTITPTPAQVCANSTGNTADGPAGATSYAWTINNGTITSATNIQTITYTAGASGVVTLNLTVTNSSNCPASNTLDVTINPAPATPTITPSPTSVCAGSPGNQASGPAGATTYAWTIANGTITSATNIQTITYTAGASGNVGLTLVVTNASSCSATNNANVPINPTPSFTPAPGALTVATYNTAYALTFAGTGGTGPYSFALAGGALAPGMTLNANGTVSPNTPSNTGAFAFSIMVTDAKGCSSTQAYTLNVQPNLGTDAYAGVGNTQFFIAGVAGAPLTPAVSSATAVLANDSPAGIAVTAGTTTCGGIGGSITIDSVGRFLYTPPVNVTGIANCIYTGTSNTISATGAINITLAGKVWYVNNSTGSDSSSRGRSHEPLATINQAVTNASAADSIFVHFTGTNYAGASLSKDGLTLWGQGTTFTLGNLTITGTSKPTINSTLTIAGNNQTVSSLDISTGSSTGITNTGTRTGVTIKNNIAVTTTTGTAVSFSNVDSSTGGSPNNGINFLSVSANGGSNGISLTNVNVSNGTFTVSGSGAAGSGGTIQHMLGADGAVAGSGVYLSNARNVSLSWMQLNDFQNFAVRGITVNGFSLSNSVINGVNGDNANGPFDEGSVAFDELTGSASISSTNVSGGLTDNFRVSNTTGSLNRITFSSVTIGTNSIANGNAGLLLDGSGTATINATIQNSFFTASRADLFHLNLSGGTAGGDLVFTGNTLSNSHPAIATGGGGVTVGGGNNTGGNNLTFNISNNTFRDANGAGVLIFKSTDPGTFSGTFASNTIGVAAVANSGSSAGDGLKIQNAGLGAVTVHVTNNQIFQYNDFGMDLEAGGGASATGGALNLTITGNTVGNPGNLLGLNTQGIMLNAGTVPGDTYAICLTLGGAGALKNSIQNSGAGASGTDFRLRQRQSTTVTLPGYVGAATDTTAVVNFVIANNNVAVPGTASVNSPPGGGFVNGGPCP